MATFEEIKENIDNYTISIEDGDLPSQIVAEDNIKRLLNETDQDVINRALNYAVRTSH